MKNISKIYDSILTKDLLKELYINQNKTMKQISHLYNCCYDSIRNRLIKYNIKIRTVSEARKLIDISGKNSGMYKIGKYCNNNNTCIDCHKRISPIAKRCGSCASIKKLNSDGRSLVKHYCKICGKELSRIDAIKCKNCYMKDFGKLKQHCKMIYYKNVHMRSSWEVSFAQFLDLSNIKWLYESKTFNLKGTTYTPDFYLPEFDCYIEVKGRWFSGSKKKFKQFKKRYKNINIKLFRKNNLCELGVI